jgi:hypothetical protein
MKVRESWRLEPIPEKHLSDACIATRSFEQSALSEVNPEALLRRQMTGAPLDRLTHHVHIPKMNGESEPVPAPGQSTSWQGMTSSALGLNRAAVPVA